MATFEPEAEPDKEVEIIDADEYQMPKPFATAVYQSSATLLNSLFFPPYEIVRSDDSDDNDINNSSSINTINDVNADNNSISSAFSEKFEHLNSQDAPNNF